MGALGCPEGDIRTIVPCSGSGYLSQLGNFGVVQCM